MDKYFMGIFICIFLVGIGSLIDFYEIHLIEKRIQILEMAKQYDYGSEEMVK